MPEIIATIQETFQAMHWAEYLAVLCGIVYIILAARENIWCWSFGIINGFLSVYLFFISNLYAESVLYIYYIIAGFYGWYAWLHKRDKNQSGPLEVVEWPGRRHLFLIIGGVGLSLVLAWLLQNFTNAQMPLVDAHTTVFSFIATWMVTRKVLSNWLYWIVIDAVSVFLYWSRDLYLYALLMLVYTGMAVYGYILWKKQQNEIAIVQNW